MASTFAENVKQKFAGELSEHELRLANELRHSFRTTLSGRQSFGNQMVSLWAMLDRLRRFRYDVDEAVASGSIATALPSPVLQDTTSPLTPAEKAFLDDAEGLIDWVTRNGVSFDTVLVILGHDVGEISRHDFSLDKTLADFVVPKVTGWAERNSTPVGEAEDQG